MKLKDFEVGARLLVRTRPRCVCRDITEVEVLERAKRAVKLQYASGVAQCWDAEGVEDWELVECIGSVYLTMDNN